MAEQLDSDRAKATDANQTIVFICVVIAAVFAFAVFGGQQKNTTNAGAGTMTGQEGLKVGVEGATSHPQLVLPR